MDSRPPLSIKSDETSNKTDNQRKRKRKRNSTSQPSSEKLKASHIQKSEIVIGDWRRPTMRVGDLIAKVYYAKKMLVWEFLNGSLKSRMEILWSDITAFKAVILENQPGILQIELGKPPSFQEEIPPIPGKHTKWEKAPDFTGGQASIHRKHVVIIPPGILDEHYKKLIRFDKRLFDLSQKSFPSQQERPYFDMGWPLPVNFNGPMAQQHPSQSNCNGPMAQQHPSEPNFNEPITQQYPSESNFNGPMAQQHPAQSNFDGPMTQQYPSESDFSGPITQQYPSESNFNGPITQQYFNGPMTQQYPSESNFNGPMTQQYPYSLPPTNEAVPGNQFVNTPNRNAGGGGGSNQLIRQQTFCGAKTMLPPRENPSLLNAKIMLLPSKGEIAHPRSKEIMLLPRASPSPQPPPSYHVSKGHNYPFNNLVAPNNIENHEIQEYHTGFTNIDEEEINPFAQVQQLDPSFFINPNHNINHYQMSDDIVNQAKMMLPNNGPFPKPDPSSSSQTGLIEDDNSPRSNDEDLYWIYKQCFTQKSSKKARD